MTAPGRISIRGVRVHNLQNIDLDLPHRKLIVICGLSGSGKSSLALDTLYAEGQRRYIESFSPYTRQFLQRLERPDADNIDGIPPAIAVTSKNTSRSSRATVGTATETYDYLRLLMAKIGQAYCHCCGREVRRDSPQSAAERLAGLPAGTKFMIVFPCPLTGPEDLRKFLQEKGFVRVIVDGRLVDLAEANVLPATSSSTPAFVVVDRLTAGGSSAGRLSDSLETAFSHGGGRCSAIIELSAAASLQPDSPTPQASKTVSQLTIMIDGRPWRLMNFSALPSCADCGTETPLLDPRLFSFNHPLGACPECEGFGNVVDLDMELIVPDPKKSLREGAVAPWNTPAYSQELDDLLRAAKVYRVDVEAPYSRLSERERKFIIEGAPDVGFGGLKGFFAWLERRKYKMHVRVFLSRWRSYRPCAACGGARLRPEALAVRLGGLNIAEICALQVREAAVFFRRLELSDWERRTAKTMLEQVQSRLGFLEAVGLGYLTLDRTLRTLSGGEARRVALAAALGSSLVGMLYVLDEPSIGLHPRDVQRLLTAITQLRDRGNTVVIVEHEETIIRAADVVIEIGPGAGHRGGKVVFQGSPQELLLSPDSLTGEYLSGRRGFSQSTRRRPEHGWLRLAGARGNNLKNITVEFPLGVLCLVTGVSGSGKSTLVQDTLYPALCRRLRKNAPKPLPYDDLYGDGQLDDVVLVDQTPIGRSPRSNPVTYLKAFDEIRAVFAETIEARTRGLTAGAFSFNVDGGRCNLCQGEGFLQVDMQFLADVYMHCPQCHGTRYREEILDVRYRGRNIAEVLEMTVREAFTFFRGRPKVQARLKRLIDVGLDYVRLGQPANTLSGGESQRLKLAAYLSGAKRGRCLFILDEPTTGLHFADVVQLLDCFDALLAAGHSLIVVEHNLQVMKAADYIIDLGPGAADEGGRVVAEGSPEKIARCSVSITGQFLSRALSEKAAENAKVTDA